MRNPKEIEEILIPDSRREGRRDYEEKMKGK